MATETPQQKRIQAQEAKKSYGRRRTELIRTLTADLKAAKDKIERYERLVMQIKKMHGILFSQLVEAFESPDADDVRDTEAGRR